MEEQSEDCCSTQIIDENGYFNVEGLDNFVKKTKLSKYELSYAVVAIIGPPSSGKSTLLNHLFHTNFREMAFSRRSRTTKGIWMAKSVGIEPFTLALDLEGTDGRERGEDDTTFEKQSAVFALAVADIVLINMWCHDIGLERAANKPLLKTVFQVMMRLFSPQKTTLLFVIRDKTKTPMELLEPSLRKDIQKLWDSVLKPDEHKNTPLSEFFNVEVVALSSYEEKEELFIEEVTELRERFFHSISPGGLASDRRAVVPASGFSFSSQQIWRVIKENRDLDLPTHKVMVSTVRCEEVANEMLHQFETDESWLELHEAVKGGPVPSFGNTLSSILEKYFSKYDTETIYFGEEVREQHRMMLEINVFALVHPSYETMLRHLQSNELESFKIRLKDSLKEGKRFADAVRDSRESSLLVFDKGVKDAAVKQATWDSSNVKDELFQGIVSYASSLMDVELSKLTTNYKVQLEQALIAPVEVLIKTGGKETWPTIRKVLKQRTDTTIKDFRNKIAGFEIEQAKIDAMIQNLKDYSQHSIENIVRKEVVSILMLMKDRFLTVFSHGKNAMPRFWTEKEDVEAITKEARKEALSLLSTMAAIRLDGRPDNIEKTLLSSLMGDTVSFTPSLKLVSSVWEGRLAKDVLLTPVQCDSLWRDFLSQTEWTIRQAVIAVEEAYKKNSKKNSKGCPEWIWLMILVIAKKRSKTINDGCYHCYRCRSYRCG